MELQQLLSLLNSWLIVIFVPYRVQSQNQLFSELEDENSLIGITFRWLENNDCNGARNRWFKEVYKLVES